MLGDHADLDSYNPTFVAGIAMKIGLGIQGLIVFFLKNNNNNNPDSILPVWIEFTKMPGSYFIGMLYILLNSTTFSKVLGQSQSLEYFLSVPPCVFPRIVCC